MNHNNEDDFIHLQREERRGKISLCDPCVMIGSVVSGTLVVVTTLSNSDAMQTGNPHSNSSLFHSPCGYTDSALYNAMFVCRPHKNLYPLQIKLKP